MDNIRISGPSGPLRGTVRISGAKNAALPILCAALLADGDHCFRNVPNLRDIHTTAKLLRVMGLDATVDGSTVSVVSRPVLEPGALVRRALQHVIDRGVLPPTATPRRHRLVEFGLRECVPAAAAA